MKPPRNDGKYSWTNHVFGKMLFYGISESLVKRIIRFPKRLEEGIAPKTVAVMQPAGTRRYSEIWVMYKIQKSILRLRSGLMVSKVEPSKISARGGSAFGGKNQRPKFGNPFPTDKKIKIITAWRYPGKSPERDPVPQDILREVRTLL